MRGGFSAPRRPRSAFKESSQEDALSLRAPRERSRKEKPVLGSSASSSSRSRNNKKKRSTLSEVQFPGSDHDQEEDGYETTEQLSPSPSRCSPAFSDEDDEHPQARRRRESSSSAPKLKLPHKVPESNIISAGLGSIPRKARSAFVKRAHEGISSAPPIPDVTASALHYISRVKAPPSPPNYNGRIRSVSPSPSAAKPTKKMKPIGTKPRPSKFLKVSAAFSEQEVEVAEVLFGFASQITSAEENLNDLKAASSSSPCLPPNVSSPVSASPSLLAQPTEGPKKKRPRSTKIDEIGSPAAPATALAYCQSTGMEIGSSDNADGVAGFINEIANVLPPTISATQNYITSSSFGQRYGELIRETVTVSEKISVKFEDSDVVAPLPEAKTTDITVKVDGASESERSPIEAEKIDRQTDVLPSENSIVKFESPVMSPSTVDAKNASLEKLEIDLMAPPEKEANISENDSTVVAADRTSTELPAEGTMGVSSVFEGKSISVDKVRDQEKREDSAEYKEREKSSCKRDLGEESVIEQHIKEENIEEDSHVDSMRGNNNDSSKLLPQKPGKITKTDSRLQKLDKPDVPSPTVSASCAVSGSANGAAGPLPISMAVAGWPGALSALGRYFGPTAATWPGTPPSLPGMMPVEGNLTKGIQRWQMLKRSATHAYIAHFIGYQQQMARNPFWNTTYGSSAALYGGKPYNLNIPFSPATEPIMGSSLPGSDPFLSARNPNIMGSSFNESNIATAALAAISGHNLKEKAASSYMDVLRKNSAQQQEAQPTSSVTIQHNLPSFGFPIMESGTSTSAIAVNTGNACPLVNSKNSGTGPPLHAGASTNLAGGTGAANSSFASMASAQAQYLAMLQQSGFHFPLPPVHFGATNTGTHNHLEHPQVFNGSFYAAAHLLHPPTHPQQQGQQNQSNAGSSSQKHQQQFNFSSPQQQTPSSSQQHHLFSPSQTSQAESGYTNGVDTALTADRKLPLGQKNLYSQGSQINSNNNANPATLLATNSLGHSQDFASMTAFGGKHNVKQQQMQITMQPHGSDPSLEMSLKGQQCNQSTKQAVGRVKGIAQSTLSNYGDHITGASNFSKSQEASISGQSQKQHDQHPPEWKVSSTVPTSAGTSNQAVVAGAIRNSSQQVRHQQVSSNLLANLAGGAIPQAVFTTSTKNYGQQSRHQHSNSSSASMSKSKTTGIPTSKTVTGSKGTVSLPQRSIAPTSGKRSSPNHMSPSLSGNKPLQQQQQQTTQSATTIGSGQVTGSKNPQYYTQAHFNPQQSYSQQIHQQLLFQQNHYLQQPVQQSQLSSQSTQHAVVHQQHLQIQGLNYSQPSLNNRHPQQEQRHQILPASSTPSDQVPNSTLSGGLPSLSLGSSSTGRSPAKIMPAGLVKANNSGTTVLHEQYSPLNDMVSTQKQCDSPRTTPSPHLAHAASVLQKSPEQKSESDCLLQDEVNGVHFVDLNICTQARTHVSTSSVQASSIQKTTGNLKKAQGGSNEESLSGQGGTNLSGVPSGHTYQDLGSANSEQTPPRPFQQTPVSRASGPISSVISNPHEAAASIVQL